MFDPRPLCYSILTTAVGGITDTNFVDSAHPTVARIAPLYPLQDGQLLYPQLCSKVGGSEHGVETSTFLQ